MFAGPETVKLIAQNLNSIGNVMNLEANTHIAYDALKWGIEAQGPGPETVKLIAQNLNSIGNVITLQGDTHTAYDALKWGIEAQGPSGNVRI
jgi:hypothetical protein